MDDLSDAQASNTASASRPRVGLFITCLVDLMRPAVGFASVKLLRDAGCDVIVPDLQTCCGQPAYNSGDRDTARSVAQHVLQLFQDVEFVVAPSSSCAGMLKHHYVRLFRAGDPDHGEAVRLSKRVYELTEFLVTVRGQTLAPVSSDTRIAHHDSCASLRETPATPNAARRLLSEATAVPALELAEREACCGFGGAFAVKFDQISNAIGQRKCAAITAAKADVLTGPDLGCLLHLAGTLRRNGSPIACRHIAEILAGDLTEAPIGHPGPVRNG
jgi:L-lactate dehydrogenase complex protein LldE